MTPEALAKCHAEAMTHASPWSAQAFAGLLAQKSTALIGDLHCFALLRVTLDEAELLTLVTSPAHRRQGLARQCLAAVEAQAASQGATTLFLEVAEDNHPACALYLAAGFHIAGQRKAYYPRATAAAADALVLRKSLSG